MVLKGALSMPFEDTLEKRQRDMERAKALTLSLDRAVEDRTVGVFGHWPKGREGILQWAGIDLDPSQSFDGGYVFVPAVREPVFFVLE